MRPASTVASSPPAALGTRLWGPPGYGERPLEVLLPWRLPWLSLTLVALHGVLFLGARGWGGVLSPVTHYRMGAALGPVGAEAWRVISAGFVHPGGWHLALHGVSLLVCGALVEGLLGPARLFWLYGVSLGVSNVSAFQVLPAQGLGMGDSGGVMGLVGALGVLACRPRLPIPWRCRAVMLTGVAAVAGSAGWVSDLWDVGGSSRAAWMGAAVGAGLAVSGLLTWRGPRYVGQGPHWWRVPESVVVDWSAGMASGALGSCLVAALLVGRPWELGGAPHLVRVRVPGTPVSVTVPERTLARATQTQDFYEGHFGEMRYGLRFMDPVVVLITARRMEEPVEEARLEQETLRLRDQLLEEAQREPLSEGYRAGLEPELDWVNRRPAVSSSLEVVGLFSNMRWSMYREGWRVDLQVLCERGPSGEANPLVDEVAQSVVVGVEGAPEWDTCAAWNPGMPEVCMSFWEG